MSTIDRVDVYDEPCPCGAGKIVITQCTPDHPYARASQTSYDARLDCAECSKIFKFSEAKSDNGREIILSSSEGASIKLISLGVFDRGFVNTYYK